MRNIYTETGKKNEKTNSNCNQSFVYVLAFRKELVEALQKEHEVILAMPFVGHEEDFSEKWESSVFPYP